MRIIEGTCPYTVYEEKSDGWRMLALKEAGRVRLVSRNDRDHTKRFRDNR
jgi:ATP-dependent DNA ligase